MPVTIFFLPLISTFLCLLCIIFKDNKKAGIISSVLMGFAAILSFYCYQEIESLTANYHIYNWVKIEDVDLKFSVFYDPLTAVMFFVVTSVSAIVHIFSIGYMEKDLYKARFFCYSV